MGAYDTPTEKCPYCGTECECDWVDNGVGMVQCGPYNCACGASEIGPERYDWAEKRQGARGEEYVIDGSSLVMKPGAPFTDDELDKGWYNPEARRISPYANTVGGVLVDHKTAKAAYDIGLLDEKVPL